MLDATIYSEALNLALENAKAANSHRDNEQANKFICSFVHIFEYLQKFGLTVDTYRQEENHIVLKRTGTEPYALNILIDGTDGWSYRTSSEDTRYYEPTYELDHYWEERRAIERDYVELPPW